MLFARQSELFIDFAILFTQYWSWGTELTLPSSKTDMSHIASENENTSISIGKPQFSFSLFPFRTFRMMLFV